MDKNYKIMIPKLITYFRLLLIPIIIVLTYFNLYIPSLVLIIVGFISDYIDNPLAKKWNTDTLSDTKIDIIISKVYEVLLLLVTKMYIILIIDIIFILINLAFYYKNKKTNILEIGYYKEIILLITIISSYINIYFIDIKFMDAIIYTCINIEIIALINYTIYNIKYKKPSINDNLMHENIISLKNIEDTLVCE